MQISQNSKATISFVLLFVLYHTAEYWILFQSNAIGFFSFQLLFFMVAFFLGRWYNGEDLGAWGLHFKSKKLFLTGVALGIILYGIPFAIALLFGIEEITYIPDFMTILKDTLPFAFGVFFSSFSEDVITRGLIFTHFKDKISPLAFIFLSATIYLFNHIYRLGDGPDTLLYLFLLGIIFCIPLIITKNLWLTGFMHWSGNTFFFVTHQIIQTESGNSIISANSLFAIFLTITIIASWKFIDRKFD